MSDSRCDDEADKWYYDLGVVAKRVERNDSQNRRAHVRVWVLATFVLFAVLLLAWRTEVNAHRIKDTQHRTCLANRAIMVRYNAEQDTLAELERTNRLIDVSVRDARIRAYLDGRVMPLPICQD